MALRILLAHNAYQQPGGEDAVFAAETSLLKRYGHPVFLLHESNHRVADFSRVGLALNTFWSRPAYRAVRRMVSAHRPDVAHFHNTFMMLSPSVYYACKEAGVPVVQTLHNYRLLCPSALLYRDGRVCEACAGRAFAWPGVRHACYRGSAAATAVTAGMLAGHRLLGTWRGVVDRYIAGTEFARRKVIAAGLPAEKVVVKPNFLAADPGPGEHDGGYCLFVGRLSEEKGVRTLLAAWRLLGGKVPLKIAGDGPLAPEVAAAAAEQPSVEWVGRRSKEEVFALMKGALLLILPSVCYEGFPMVIVEAFATGLPVVSSRLGGMAEAVTDGHTGLHCEPGDAEALAATVERAVASVAQVREMGRNARAEFAARYTAERNYQQLLAIYEAARAGS